MSVVIPNVLAERYATTEMREIFDPVTRVRLERQLWVAVLEAQTELGVPVPAGAVEAYRSAVDTIDLASIERRDREIRHDVKARIDEFNALAGYEEIHKGLTSRDATENVEQLVVWRALDLVEQRSVALLARLAEKASALATIAVVGRTHNVPAQLTTVGKRFAQVGEELLGAYEALLALRASFSIRGIKGPVGSQQDQLDLLGSPEAVQELERRVAEHLGIPSTLSVVGQVYPRSLDYAVVAALVRLAAAPSNLALTIRLMAGHDLATEGFRDGQTGSSAMPHKMNTRSCERVNGLQTVLQGHLTMASGLSGDQWNEGDVACSVVRRIVLPDAFFTIDGLYETIFSVVEDFGVYQGVIRTEIDRYLPFLATTALLLHGVRNGMGREEAHRVIKEHAVAAALQLREGQADGTELLRTLGEAKEFPGNSEELSRVVDGVMSRLGTIEEQIGSFCSRVEKIVAARPEASYAGSDVV
ncbi:MAG: adenylosuccinate lyase [Acidimicrobiales bacterium]